MILKWFLDNILTNHTLKNIIFYDFSNGLFYSKINRKHK